MQSVSSRIWTPVAVSISYDDNDYTTGTFQKVVDYATSGYLGSMEDTIIAITPRSTLTKCGGINKIQFDLLKNCLHSRGPCDD